MVADEKAMGIASRGLCLDSKWTPERGLGGGKVRKSLSYLVGPPGLGPATSCSPIKAQVRRGRGGAGNLPGQLWRGAASSGGRDVPALSNYTK